MKGRQDVATDADEQPSIADFVTIDRSGETTAVVAVATVVWDGPHRPALQWSSYDRTFGAELTDEQIVHVVSGDSRFFSVCLRCGRLANAGHMHSKSICQGCAERYLGVVH